MKLPLIGETRLQERKAQYRSGKLVAQAGVPPKAACRSRAANYIAIMYLKRQRRGIEGIYCAALVDLPD